MPSPTRSSWPNSWRHVVALLFQIEGGDKAGRRADVTDAINVRWDVWGGELT